MMKSGCGVIPEFYLASVRSWTKISLPGSLEIDREVPESDRVEARAHNRATSSHHGSQKITNNASNMEQRHHVH